MRSNTAAPAAAQSAARGVASTQQVSHAVVAVMTDGRREYLRVFSVGERLPGAQAPLDYRAALREAQRCLRRHQRLLARFPNDAVITLRTMTVTVVG